MVFPLSPALDDTIARGQSGHNDDHERIAAALNAVGSEVALVTNVLGYGATGDGTTDDTTAVQAALDAAAVAGGTVYFPPGTYMVTALTVGDAVTLQGAGPWASEIKQIASTNAHLLTLESGSTLNAGVRDLLLHGNNDNQTDANDLIHFDNTAGGASTLARHRILNVHLRSAKGNGLYLGPYSRSTIVRDVNIYDCDAVGMVLEGADSQVSNVDVGQSGDDGVQVIGASYQLKNVKSWYSGRLGTNGRGYLISGDNNILSNCVSQENRAHGFLVFKSGTDVHAVLTGCMSDGDGTIASQVGFSVARLIGGVVSGTVTKFSGAIGTPASGLHVESGTDCDIHLTVNGHSGPDITASSTLTSCRVTVNGTLVTRPPDPLAPTGAIAETHPRISRMEGSPTASLVSGRLSLFAIPLSAGDVVTSITFLSAGTAADTPTNQWFALYSPALAKLGVTADDTTTAWAANTAKTLALSSAYTVLTTGVYYLGCCVVATTAPTLKGTEMTVGVTGIAPILSGSSTTGLTDPASAPATAAALTALAPYPYAYVT